MGNDTEYNSDLISSKSKLGECALVNCNWKEIGRDGKKERKTRIRESERARLLLSEMESKN